jgi:hypothetical protein
MLCTLTIYQYIYQHSVYQPLGTQSAKLTADYIGDGEVAGVSPLSGISLLNSGLKLPVLWWEFYTNLHVVS